MNCLCGDRKPSFLTWSVVWGISLYTPTQLEEMCVTRSFVLDIPEICWEYWLTSFLVVVKITWFLYNILNCCLGCYLTLRLFLNFLVIFCLPNWLEDRNRIFGVPPITSTLPFLNMLRSVLFEIHRAINLKITMWFVNIKSFF